MQRSQWLAVFTGAVAILLGVGYLVLVQILDSRGEMIPAPIGTLLTTYHALLINTLSLGCPYFAS